VARRRIAGVALVACVVFAAAASSAFASDGGSGSYTVAGLTYDFTFLNSGTTTWQYFYVVGPPGTTFVGGGTISEASPHCGVGEPDGRPDEIECGPLPTSLAPPSVHFGFTATVAAPVPCGAPFGLYVSSTGIAPFTRADDIVPSGTCTATAPHAIRPPTIAGFAVVGRTLSATAPVWSATPSRVSYAWQRCTKTACSAIRGAKSLRLKLTSRDRGRWVRLVATATLSGTRVTSTSGKLLVRRA
jgi:hypothetical protein